MTNWSQESDRLFWGLALEDTPAIIAYIAQHPDCPSAAIAAAIGPASRDYAQRLLKLVQAGWVERREEGHGKGRRYRYRVREDAREALRAFLDDLEPRVNCPECPDPCINPHHQTERTQDGDHCP